MDRSKIQLSAEEIKLVNNSSWILTKQAIIQKVCLLLGDLSEELQAEWSKQNFTITTPSPKISKGELYESLPWVVLDYPRIFSKEDVFAVRCFFWWANYFSITLHLKGKYLAFFKGYPQELGESGDKDLFVSTGGDEFGFNLEAGDYKPWTSAEGHTATGEMRVAFLKITKRIPLGDWNQVPEIMLEQFRQWMAYAAKG
jgi:hypothetical protein